MGLACLVASVLPSAEGTHGKRSTMDASHPGIPMTPASHEQTTAMLRAKLQSIKEARVMCELFHVEVEDTAPLDMILRRLSKAMIQTMKSNQSLKRWPEGIEEIIA